MADKPATDPGEDAPTGHDVPRPDRPAGPGEALVSEDPVSDLQRERDDYYDRWLRKTAEFDNYRRRVERERREQGEQAVVALLLELLGVVDDFDRALTQPSSEGGEAAAYRKGVELIHAKLHDLLRKQGVKPIETLGADFDPNLHQAVLHEESPAHREGEVIGELRRGYTLHGRLLRPAMVKVAKA
jgi:molecular chaperone GrpE